MEKHAGQWEVTKVIIMVVFHHQLYWGHFVSSLLFQHLIIKRTALKNIVFTFVQMKKLLVSILALLYITTSSGAVLHMHYCMGKLADWGLGHNKSETCGNCGMDKSEEKANGCCKDEYKFIKNGKDQKTAEAGLQMLQVLAVALPVSIIEISSKDFPSVTEQSLFNYIPPRSSSVALYLRNCIFLI